MGREDAVQRVKRGHTGTWENGPEPTQGQAVSRVHLSPHSSFALNAQVPSGEDAISHGARPWPGPEVREAEGGSRRARAAARPALPVTSNDPPHIKQTWTSALRPSGPHAAVSRGPGYLELCSRRNSGKCNSGFAELTRYTFTTDVMLGGGFRHQSGAWQCWPRANSV